ncbi:ring-7 protein [Moniliophthora roreri]|uniref:Uncharacterized protein n=1 Tax=Moniliophthora roreri TaxID=221103 RepID=A0A0W0G8V5_MONRR|nr:ring-7 protein [Moniliophthora roreri]
MVFLGLYTLLFTLFTIGCKGFIPAYPTNDTQAAVNAGINLKDGSTIDIKWFDKGMFLAPVSYQFPGQGSTGLVEGAFVQFTEPSGIEATSTPWIALISCDANSTDASPEQDIFTYAHSKGAVGAASTTPTSIQYASSSYMYSFSTPSTPPPASSPRTWTQAQSTYSSPPKTRSPE